MKQLRLTRMPNTLDITIDEALKSLSKLDITTEEYAEAMDRVAELAKLKEKNSKSHVSPDTLAIVIGNLAGIVLILGYERAHVVTSKALGFVIRTK